MSKLLIFRKAITKDSSRSSDTGDNVDFLAVPASNIANMSATLGEVVLTLKDGNDFSDQALSNSSSTTLTFCNVVFTVTEGTELNVVNSIWKSTYGDSDVVYFDGVNSVFPIQEILSIKSIIRTTPPTFTDPSSGGASLPTGGVATQVLTKQSATDGDADWEYPDTLYVLVRNTSGSDLDKGTPVHATGVTGDVADVIVADASSAAAMPATYILNEDTLNNEQGLAIISGVITDVDTSSFSPGDKVYVAAGGGFTNVKPTGTNLIQNLGVVTKSNASTGSGVIYGAGRSNDVPNLPTGKFFIGSASNTQESAYTLPTADGSANEVLATNGAGAVSFVTRATEAYVDTAANTLTENSQTGTSYTTVLADAGKMITCNNASAITVNIPRSSTVAYEAGTVLSFVQKGAGQITLTPISGVTLNGANGLKTASQYSVISCWKEDTDTWIVYGDTTT